MERLSQSDQLSLYAHYKQATAGGCTTAKPRFNLLRGFAHAADMAKWSAWQDLHMMPKEEARAKYVQILDAFEPRWRDHCQAEASHVDLSQRDGEKRLTDDASLDDTREFSDDTRELTDDQLFMSENEYEAMVEAKRHAASSPGDDEDYQSTDKSATAGAALSRVRDDTADVPSTSAEAALFEFCRDAQVSLAEIMKRIHATPNAQQLCDEQGCTLLHWAADGGNADLVAALVDNIGCDLNARDNEGQTPLHYAAICGHQFLVGEMLRRGADGEARDASGMRARDVAPEMFHGVTNVC